MKRVVFKYCSGHFQPILWSLLLISITSCQVLSSTPSTFNSPVYIKFTREQNEIWLLPSGDRARAAPIYQIYSAISFASAMHSNLIQSGTIEILRNAHISDTDLLEVTLSDLALSPNKTLLAWQESYQWCPGNYCLGQFDIKVMQVQDQSVIADISTSNIFSAPVWSPEGNYLAFDEQIVSKAEPLTFKIWLWNTVTKHITTIDNGYSPSWSPDGKSLVAMEDNASASKQESGLEIIDIATGKKQEIKPAFGNFDFFFDPTWSPDGRRLVMVGGQSKDASLAYVVNPLFYMDVQSSGINNLTPVTSPGTFREPIWSPNGKWIGTKEVDTNNPFGLIILDAANGKQVLDIGKMLERVREWHWSEDGTKIVCVSFQASGDPLTQIISIIQVPSGEKHTIEFP